MKSIKINLLKRIAKNLIMADGGDNVEYARGICEFLADVDGVEDRPHAERALELGVELGVTDTNLRKFYGL